MLPRPNEISAAVWGAWLLLKHDASGLEYMDPSLRGFLSSFVVIVLGVPLFFLIVWFSSMHDPEISGISSITDGRIIWYVTSFIVIPLVFYAVLSLIQIEGRFFHLVVAYNWATLIMLVIVLVAQIVVTPLYPGSAIVAGVGLALYAFTLYYTWFVIRTALETSTGIAIALVALDAMVSIGLRSMIIGSA